MRAVFCAIVASLVPTERWWVERVFVYTMTLKVGEALEGLMFAEGQYIAWLNTFRHWKYLVNIHGFSMSLILSLFVSIILIILSICIFVLGGKREDSTERRRVGRFDKSLSGAPPKIPSRPRSRLNAASPFRHLNTSHSQSPTHTPRRFSPSCLPNA